MSSTLAFGAPATPVSGTVSATLTETAPAGAATQSQVRAAQGTTSADTFFLYLLFTPWCSVTFSSLPSITITLPPVISTANRQFFYAFSDLHASTPFLTVGPAQVSGQTLTFPASPGPLTLTAGKTYVFSFYSTPAPVQPSIYVSNQIQGLSGPYGSLIVYPPGASGNAAPSATIGGASTGLTFPASDIALDAGGKTYVPVNNSILVYAANANGNVAPVTTISGASTGLNTPNGLTLDTAGNLYVVNKGADSVTVYGSGASGNAAPTRTISGAATGLDQPNKIAVSTNGTIYVTNSAGAATNTVTVYASGASGNAAPIATISGTNTGLDAPDGITVSSAGVIYVTNAAGNSVTEFAAGATGNVTPTAVISGSSTGLADPQGVALDAAGKIYVANDGTAKNAGTLTVYAPGSTGNVAPTTTISGSATGINNLRGVALK